MQTILLRFLRIVHNGHKNFFVKFKGDYLWKLVLTNY